MVCYKTFYVRRGTHRLSAMRRSRKNAHRHSLYRPSGQRRQRPRRARPAPFPGLALRRHDMYPHGGGSYLLCQTSASRHGKQRVPRPPTPRPQNFGGSLHRRTGERGSRVRMDVAPSDGVRSPCARPDGTGHVLMGTEQSIIWKNGDHGVQSTAGGIV